MIDLSKFKGFGSKIIKPVIKPYKPAVLPVLRQLPRINFKPALVGQGQQTLQPKPKNILLSNGMALK